MGVKLKWSNAFPENLITKIDKTRLGRGGAEIYNRHNNRAYRVIIHYVTYIKLLKENKQILEKYKRGYVVMVKPNQYFKDNGEIQDNFHKTLKLGKNSFLYFENPKDWQKYKIYCSNFNDVYELQTGYMSKVKNEDQWGGEIAKFITNRNPQIISLICHTGDIKDDDHKKYYKKVKKKYESLKKKYKSLNIKIRPFPSQTGLGNYDYDYASEEEQLNICYQLSMMILKIPKIKEELKKRDNTLNDAKINEVNEHIINYCKQNRLYDLEKLKSIRALNNEEIPVCPLCLEEIKPESFFETKKQIEGREVEHNTQAEIALMHIEALVPTKFNHKTYNLGWGHEHCNKIQGEHSIKRTIENLGRILNNQSKT